MDKFKNFVTNLYTDFKGGVKRVFNTDISKLRFETVVSLLIKTVLFMALIRDGNAAEIKFINIDVKYWFIYVAFILIFYSFGYLLSKGKQIVFLILPCDYLLLK